MSDDNRLTLTLRELADRLSISVEAARQRAKRAHRAEKWRILPPNFPGAPLVIEVPLEDLTPALTNTPQRNNPVGKSDKGEEVNTFTPAAPERNKAVEALADALAHNRQEVNRLTDLLIEARSDAAAAEAREKLTAERNAALDSEIVALRVQIEASREKVATLAVLLDEHNQLHEQAESLQERLDAHNARGWFGRMFKKV